MYTKKKLNNIQTHTRLEIESIQYNNKKKKMIMIKSLSLINNFFFAIFFDPFHITEKSLKLINYSVICWKKIVKVYLNNISTQ